MGDIARSKGITQIARETGLGRESLYKALSAEGNPEFATVVKIMKALGLRLHATPISVRS
jgi:probable addiction module antidote protein